MSTGIICSCPEYRLFHEFFFFFKMECVKLCLVCQQPYRMRDWMVCYGIPLKSKQNRSRVCSSVCDQSLQYCLGLAHGFLLLHVLQHVCGLIGWKGDVSPVTCTGKHWHSVDREACEDGHSHSDTSVKREPPCASHSEDDITDRVFADADECSYSDFEMADTCQESLEKDLLPGLHTPARESDSSHTATNCIASPQHTGTMYSTNAETKPKIQCKCCHSNFLSPNYQSLAEHLCAVHTQEIKLDIICGMCGALFQDIQLLQQHKDSDHCPRMRRNELARIGKYECVQHLQVFSSRDLLQNHHQNCHSVTKQTPTDCNTHGRRFSKTVQSSWRTNTEHKPNCGDRKRHRCPRCNKEYPSQLRLRRHNQFVHSQQEAVDCGICGKSFRNKLLRKHHAQFMHSTQKPSSCRVCGKTYRNAHLLKMHSKLVHKVKIVGGDCRETLLQCIYCTHTFSTSSDNVITKHLEELHNQTSLPPPSLTCNECGSEFRKKVNLNQHMKTVHPVAAVAKVRADCKAEREKKRYPCDKCGKTYTQSALSRHIRIHHTTHDPVDCDVCGKTLINSFHLSQHKRQHVPTRICDICGANFKTDAGLRGHLAAHQGTKSHMCEVCGVGFVRKTSWQRHVKLHSESVHLQCDCCPKTFKTVYALNTHMLAKHLRGVFFLNRLKTLEEVGYAVDREAVARHLNHQCVVCSENMVNGTCPAHREDCLLSFKCNHCEVVVSHVNDLCLHLKKHNIPLAFTASTGNFTASWSAKRDDTDVDYTCQVCHKSFKRRENLNGHMKQHREKAYECHICLKKFTYKCNMKNHLKTHSEDKPFQCELCPKAFKCKQLLNNHRLVHNLNQSPFKCRICGKGLTRKFFLQRHYKQMHPGATV